MVISLGKSTSQMASRSAGAKSGRFVLRMPGQTHAMLEAAARASRLSLNAYCVRKLTSAGPGGLVDEPGAAFVSRAAAIAGDALVAVILHGSWARGDATPGSDVDLLVVVEPRAAPNRQWYRDWDARPAVWEGRPVDAHFVHPPVEEALSAFWAEVAIDGTVIFDRDRRISVALARIRRAIASGRFVRRVVHGQPYWTEAG